MHELLHELLISHNHEKWGHDQSLNFSVHTIVYQIASVNALMQGYTRRNTYNQLQAKPDNGKHR